MITSNASKIAEELRQYQEEVKRKLTHMVKSYVSELAESAVGATPLGDSTKHLAWYQRRFNSTGLQPIEGLAKASLDAAKSILFRLAQQGDEKIDVLSLNAAVS